MQIFLTGELKNSTIMYENNNTFLNNRDRIYQSIAVDVKLYTQTMKTEDYCNGYLFSKKYINYITVIIEKWNVCQLNTGRRGLVTLHSCSLIFIQKVL